jgi:thiol-disulfide isomerase/thioredoxin
LLDSCKNENFINEISVNKADHIQLENLKMEYLKRYGSTHNLLHFSTYLAEKLKDAENADLLQVLFLEKIIEGTKEWEGITEDPLTYFVKDFENSFRQRYPESTHSAKIVKILSDYFINNEKEVAYNFFAIDTMGQETNLVNYRGKTVVLDFWASWCVPCLQQMPYLEKIKEEFADENVVFITVNMDDDEAKWKNFIRKKKPYNEISTRLPLGGKDPQATKMEVNTLPVYQIIDKEGRYITHDGPKPSSAVFSEILRLSL